MSRLVSPEHNGTIERDAFNGFRTSTTWLAHLRFKLKFSLQNRTEHSHSYVGYTYIIPFSTTFILYLTGWFQCHNRSPTVICEDKIALIRIHITLLTTTWLIYDYHNMSVQHSQQFLDGCCVLQINKTLLKKSLTPELIYLYMPVIIWG
jgi:hypothetical protein